MFGFQTSRKRREADWISVYPWKQSRQQCVDPRPKRLHLHDWYTRGARARVAKEDEPFESDVLVKISSSVCKITRRWGWGCCVLVPLVFCCLVSEQALYGSFPQQPLCIYVKSTQLPWRKRFNSGGERKSYPAAFLIRCLFYFWLDIPWFLYLLECGVSREEGKEKGQNGSFQPRQERKVET